MIILRIFYDMMNGNNGFKDKPVFNLLFFSKLFSFDFFTFFFNKDG